MSHSFYRSLLSGSSEGDVGLFRAFAVAARTRRAALALATDELLEGLWVEDEAPPEATRGVPLLRMAADDGADARVLSERPVAVEGAPGWAVSVASEPTIDGGSLFTLTRVWQGAEPAPRGPAIAAVIAGEKTDLTLHLALRAHEASRQVAMAISPTGRLQAMAWAISE